MIAICSNLDLYWRGVGEITGSNYNNVLQQRYHGFYGFHRFHLNVKPGLIKPKSRTSFESFEEEGKYIYVVLGKSCHKILH
jgi:hypothetical protein